jgi:UDP-N-acetylmuramate dehydrogenase
MPTAQQTFEESLRENVPLGSMTTLGIGGPARFFADIKTTDDLISGAAWARLRGLPLFVLGGGSNVVVADTGFPGLTLRVSITGVESRFDDQAVVITAGAGEEWDWLVAQCVANNWSGFECLSGIPGRVGATPIQNVGAYGQETSETLVSVEAFDLTTNRLATLGAAECGFGYRTSRFKARDRNRFVITRVTYRVSADGKPSIRYADLQRHLTERGLERPTLAEVREAVLAIRRSKAMVIDSADPDSRSVGSFFVNPTVGLEQFEQLKRRIQSQGERGSNIVAFPLSDGRVKLSAAWLIEQAGFKRGYIHGRVGTSTKHALAIINRDAGTAREIVELKELIQSRVFDLFGIDLTPEPVLIGM